MARKILKENVFSRNPLGIQAFPQKFPIEVWQRACQQGKGRKRKWQYAERTLGGFS
jgi:hypothetical protein